MVVKMLFIIRLLDLQNITFLQINIKIILYDCFKAEWSR